MSTAAPKVDNPEKHFQRVPEVLSAKSYIMSVKKTDYSHGIIFDSAEEVADALRFYDGGEVTDSDATQRNLNEAVDKSYGGVAVGLVLLTGEKNREGGFTEKHVIQAMLKGLEADGRFYGDYDYDAMGTNFFKTSVTVNKVGGKYVLDMSRAYSAPPLGKLAEKFKRPFALDSSRAVAKLSIVDDWWFNADFKELLKGVPLKTRPSVRDSDYTVDLTEEEKMEYMRDLAGRYEHRREFQRNRYSGSVCFEHNGRTFDLDIRLDFMPMRPEGGHDYYGEARDTAVVGPAWTVYKEDGNTRIPPTACNPKLEFSVSVPSKFARNTIVDPKEIKTVQKARDHIAKLVKAAA